VSDNQSLVTTVAADIEREISADDSSTAIAGKLFWQYPKYRMDLTQPEEMHIIFDGQRLLTRIPSEKELRVKDVANQGDLEATGETPWLPSLSTLRSSYDFRVVGQGPIEGNDVWVLEGAARDTANATRRVMVWITKSNSDPLRLETYGAGESPTTIYLVDSMETVESIRIPVRFQTWAGLGSSTLHTTTAYSRIRLNQELDDELFRIELKGERRK
jgi:outer membrane lipoprotein-sorting protein